MGGQTELLKFAINLLTIGKTDEEKEEDEILKAHFGSGCRATITILTCGLL